MIEQTSWIPAWIEANLIGSANSHMALATATALLAVLFLAFAYRFFLVGRQLRAADHYRLTAEASGGVCFEYDIESRRLRWINRDRLALLGLDSGTPFQIGAESDRVHPDDRVSLKNLLDGFAGGRKADLQFRMLTLADTWAWFSISAIPVSGRKGRLSKAIGVLRSTDALHEMQKKIAEDRRLETLGTIAGGIAHEFNNHLTPVRGFIELALDDLPPDHPSYDGLETALDRVIHCSELVSQIQAYGRKSLLVMKPTNVAQVLDEAVASSMAAHGKLAHDVDLKQAWPENLPQTQLDTNQFKQAVSHLVRNALEAMRKGGCMTIHASERWVTEEDCVGKQEAKMGHYVAVSVKDTGSGIPLEHLNRVMDPFYTTHGRARASGMGLSMVHGMMAQHGGWMDIVTAPNSGTEIILYFPVDEALAVEGAPPTREDGTLCLPAICEAGRVLAADDEVFIRNLVRKMFEAEEWTVDESVDHPATISRFTDATESSYDLVVLDLTMPGGTAEETIETILRESPETKILISSGKHHDERVERMVLHPGVEFIPKPFSPRELMAKVDSMLPVGRRREPELDRDALPSEMNVADTVLFDKKHTS